MMNLNSSYVLGLGAISCFGDDLNVLASAVENNTSAPVSDKKINYQGQSFATPVYKIPTFELLTELPVAVERRLGNLSRVCFQAILRAMQDASFEVTNPARVGIIIGTAHGATSVIEKYSKRIAIDGGQSASPILFSNSVHNSVSSFISLSLGINGPSTTIISAELSTASAIERANSWLNEGVVDHVLIAVGDELYQKKLISDCLEGDQKNPDDFNPLLKASPIVGEGALGLVLSKTKKTAQQQTIKAITGSSFQDFTLGRNIVMDVKGNSLALDSAKKIASNSHLASYGRQYGSFTTGGALDLAISSYALRKNQVLASTAQHPEIKTIDEPISNTNQAELVQVSVNGEIGWIQIEST